MKYLSGLLDRTYGGVPRVAPRLASRFAAESGPVTAVKEAEPLRLENEDPVESMTAPPAAGSVRPAPGLPLRSEQQLGQRGVQAYQHASERQVSQPPAAGQPPAPEPRREIQTDPDLLTPAPIDPRRTAPQALSAELQAPARTVALPARGDAGAPIPAPEAEPESPSRQAAVPRSQRLSEKRAIDRDEPALADRQEVDPRIIGSLGEVAIGRPPRQVSPIEQPPLEHTAESRSAAVPEPEGSAAASLRVDVSTPAAPVTGPTIQVRIGRIEVRAAAPARPVAVAPPRPALALADYLARPKGGPR